MVSKLTSEIETVDVAPTEHVPENENSSGIVSLPVRASVATTATKECKMNFDNIVSTNDADDIVLEMVVKPVDPISGCAYICNSEVVPAEKAIDQPLKGIDDTNKEGSESVVKPIDPVAGRAYVCKLEVVALGK